VYNIDVEDQRDPTAFDVVVGSTHSYNESGSGNGINDKENHDDVENAYSKSKNKVDEYLGMF
jgi:hypothetical protein